jgi:transposase
MGRLSLYRVRLTDTEADSLRKNVQHGTWLARNLIRARILLLSYDQPALSQSALAAQAGCSTAKVRRTWRRYTKDGLEAALHDQPRPGTPHRLTPEHEAFVIATACTDAPSGADHWTVSLLKQRLATQHNKNVGEETIRRVLLKNNLKPWLKKNVVHPQTGRPVH